MANINQPDKFDLRVIERNLRNGLITKEEIATHMKQLADMENNAEAITLEDATAEGEQATGPAESMPAESMPAESTPAVAPVTPSYDSMA